eukprot:TRINITY_DN7355_c0_g1_i5.p1 TRINITY_DN7355_c0_g1~~TRINITY_DN7355_c0_g1_i5.p1  ORF type:complete len:423 (+),score=142.29 TRINITY_DN7355_c0_g1_i5:143-1270(+)
MSSLALNFEKETWLFDCGEGTQHQIVRCKTVNRNKIKKIFITHMHGDHMYGIVPLMCSTFNGAGGEVNPEDETRDQEAQETKPVEIYGPEGLRKYIRNSLRLTYTHLGSSYVVHELHFEKRDEDMEELLEAEKRGRDILIEGGEWKSIFSDENYTVHAAPILHSVPSLGFVINEADLPGKLDMKEYKPKLDKNKEALAKEGIKNPMALLSKLQAGENITLPDGTVLKPPPSRPGRKLVILGDTYDPSGIASLSQDATLLIHEATNACLPPTVDPGAKETDTEEAVEEKAKSHGHSTPQMAAQFAKKINARSLVMNHFSSRYKGDDDAKSIEIMEAIRMLAVKSLGDPSRTVICAKDFMNLDISKEGEVKLSKLQQ